MQHKLRNPKKGPVRGEFPKEPLENVSAEKVRELLIKNRFDVPRGVMEMGRTAVSGLAECLEYEDVQKCAVETLPRMADSGVDCSSAIPALKRLLKVDNRMMQWKAALALGCIGDASVIPALVECLKSRNDALVEATAWALMRLGFPVVLTLIGRLKDPDPAAQAEAAAALGFIAGTYPKEVASVIVSYINGEEGNGLLMTDSRTGEFFNRLDKVMQKCAKAMENAA